MGFRVAVLRKLEPLRADLVDDSPFQTEIQIFVTYLEFSTVTFADANVTKHHSLPNSLISTVFTSL